MNNIKPLTRGKLNRISSLEDKELNRCIKEINEILIREWHLKDSVEESHGYWTSQAKPQWGYAAFNAAKKMFRKNGIAITYYQPNRLFSFKEI